MMLSRNKTVALVILVAMVIILLCHGGSLSDSNRKGNGYLHRTPVDTHPRIVFTSLRPPQHGEKELKAGPTLAKDVIDHIEKFVFYPRSGHSVVGSLMDAHPHMVIANEFMLFRIWKYFSERQRQTGEENPFFQNQGNLFTAIYRRSIYDVENGFRSENNTRKNYTLHVNYSWQGKFDKYITVIGDKSGTSTSDNYLSSSEAFTRYLKELKTTVKVPIKVLHVVRNPFDQISTCVLYKDYRELSKYIDMALKQDGDKKKKNPSKPLSVSNYKAVMEALQLSGDEEAFAAARYDSETQMNVCIERLVRRASAATAVIELIGRNNVLDVHNRNLVSDPTTTMAQLCLFLEVHCDPDYLQACADKVFKSISKTRDILVWSPQMKQRVEEEVIQKYLFFSKYSFESD